MLIDLLREQSEATGYPRAPLPMLAYRQMLAEQRATSFEAMFERPAGRA